MRNFRLSVYGICSNYLANKDKLYIRGLATKGSVPKLPVSMSFRE